MADYEYFDHDADIGIIGRGDTLEDAFVGAARATFAVLAPPAQIGDRIEIEVSFSEDDPELALVTWLNELLAEARGRACVFRDFTLRRDGEHWIGRARGDRLDDDAERGTEVKGATLTELSVERRGGHWRAACVIDV